ncbi:PKD domain-containing protein [Pedobacter jejuensis]|uniref:PKD domain-containing protein n=1 Tax=Pedobacter jejuensis TaxID=1268550 RepID=A0A3N0BP04_9SPHI|nr:PKD domain-containing protein [Pedobacter jejuensis]RNL50574.1 PKD domain-containing protein [Pedobacter jejuensis]
MKTWFIKISRTAVIFLAFLFFASPVFAQLTIGTVDSGPYTPGSTIAVPFKIVPNSCITQGNVFQLYLSDASGDFTNEKLIGTYNGFYSTYVNGIIPVTTPAGTGYQVRVKSITPAFISDVSEAFEIKAGTIVEAKLVAPLLTSTNTETFGTCTTKDNNDIALSNQSTTSAAVTAAITNELTSISTTLAFDTQNKIFTASLAHYTVFVKAVMPDGRVATKAYMVVNNSAVTAFSTAGNNVVCLPLGYLTFTVVTSGIGGIQNNFPGDVYRINWGDGVSETYTLCEILQNSNLVRHLYTKSSCGLTSTGSSGSIFNVFDITINVTNAFCGNIGTAVSTTAKVVVKPVNSFTFNNPGCTNADITFINTSIVGENPNTSTAGCTPNNLTYNWFVDGVLIEANKPRSFNFVQKFTTHGKHVIRLTSTSSGVCDADPVIQDVCIQDPPQPIFTLTGNTFCAPAIVTPIDASILDFFCNTDNNYTWTVVPSVGFANGTSASSKAPDFNFTTAGTYTITLSISTPSCGIVTSAPQTIVISGANAGIDQSLCSGNEISLSGNDPGSYAGKWLLVSGQTGISFADENIYNTKAIGLVPGQLYTFRWTITGTATCPLSYDEVTITYPPSVTNTITFASTTVCSGQNITITGDIPTGGNGTFSYQWQTSTDGNVWVNIAGRTTKDLTIATVNSFFYRRQVTSGGCSSSSNAIQISVLPAIADNNISADQSICIGATVLPLTGTPPTGGDGTNFTYQWQSSINGTTWVDITGATLINYAPPQPTATIYYRRLVASGACSGTSQNSSNTVTITVNQPAKAEINFINDKGCAPFALTAANITAGLYPGRNSTFTWFADNVQIGTGATFPGYNLATDNSSVIIKLVVTSGANCVGDVISHTFSTYQSVTPNFTQNVTDGCGPLSVTVVNTSSSLTAATFKWDFGNGTTSNLATPPTVIYQPDPAGLDITYTIKLETTTPCGTLTKTSTVLVKAQPISVFSPDKTTGCSPFTATFSNTSPGNYTSFTYDFGDGTTLNTRDKNSVTHTYTTIAVKDYIVKMTARNDCGVNESQYTIRVSPNNILPELVVNATELKGCAPLTVNFFNNTKGASTFYYDFADGSSALTSTAPEMIAHTFTKPGSYLVTLYASNSCSNAYTTETIVVLDQPTVAFTSDKTIGCSGTVISFKNNSKNAITYLWDFGDGTTSTAFEPQHTFTGTATHYTVSLKATNLQGCSNTSIIPNYINLVAPPQSIFTVLPGNELSIPNFAFSFRDASLNGAGSWEWNFGDGSTSTLQNPTHTYANVGDYTVTLKVLNKEGCPGTSSQVVRIIGVPGFLYVPNSFMPASQKNELQAFKAKGRGIDNWTMTIFNKWGQVLWETTKLSDGSPLEGWDGKYNGQEQPQGVYFWKIDLKFINGGEWKGMTYDSSAPKKTGNIYLIR